MEFSLRVRAIDILLCFFEKILLAGTVHYYASKCSQKSCLTQLWVYRMENYYKQNKENQKIRVCYLLLNTFLETWYAQKYSYKSDMLRGT